MCYTSTSRMKTLTQKFKPTHETIEIQVKDTMQNPIGDAKPTNVAKLLRIFRETQRFQEIFWEAHRGFWKEISGKVIIFRYYIFLSRLEIWSPWVTLIYDGIIFGEWAGRLFIAKLAPFNQATVSECDVSVSKLLGFETSRFRNFSIFLVVSDSVSENFGCCCNFDFPESNLEHFHWHRTSLLAF